VAALVQHLAVEHSVTPPPPPPATPPAPPLATPDSEQHDVKAILEQSTVETRTAIAKDLIHAASSIVEKHNLIIAMASTSRFHQMSRLEVRLPKTTGSVLYHSEINCLGSLRVK
jgi:hypothetical protein